MMVYTGKTNNNMKARSIPVIALNKSNEQGCHHVMSSYARKPLHSYKWTELPIDNVIIDRVEELAS